MLNNPAYAKQLKQNSENALIIAKNLFEAKPSYFLRLLRSQSSGCFAEAGDFSLVTFF